MPNTSARFVSLAIAAVPVPASTDDTHPATTHLAAIGILIAERDRDGAWSFRNERCAIGAGDGEDRLLGWAVANLPERGTMIGWQLADRILPPLLDAGTTGDPETGRAFLDRLIKLVTAPSIDLAVPHGGAGAPPLGEVIARRGIACDAMRDEDVESAWAFGNVSRLHDHVSALVIATWRLWLVESNGTAGAASAAFEAWLRR